MDLLQFAVATIIQPSAWLFFGFGLIILTAGSRRLLCRFKRWRHPEPRSQPRSYRAIIGNDPDAEAMGSQRYCTLSDL